MPAACRPVDDVRGTDPDAELLRRIARRDHEAFERLYRRYVRPVYGLALRRSADREAAADAVRRTFAAIWSSAAADVPEGDGGARWIFTVACTEIDDASDRPPAESGWPAFRVHAAVSGLPEDERTALELAYWSDRSRGEIATLLGVPVAVVESRTRTALALLAARLEGPDD